MKAKFLAVFLVLITTLCVAQKNNEVRLYGGFVGSDLMGIAQDGGGSSNNENTFEFGVKYLRNITEDLQIETGIGFFETQVKIEPHYEGKPVQSWQENLKVIKIPLFANYSFAKYFFINGGFLLSFDKSKGTIVSQSGIGYGLGVGAKYEVKNVVFYLNPNLKRCAAFIPFDKRNRNKKLTELTVEFGIGYRF
ncbi:MAG: outer membrane beta-barrel protein [Flavobacteriaceae bacterium]|nr:outer membrane beta-barrel protein [Flavobacteriaceae bacterium]